MAPQVEKELFMCVSSLPSSPSFEELRVQDYITAYRTTGHPPVPAPVEPTSINARAALGLPPPFEPFVVESGAGNISPSVSDQATTIRNPIDLPQYHVFNPSEAGASTSGNSTTGGGDKFQSIVTQNAFTAFSPEELRFYAYSLGNITPPPSLATSMSTPTLSSYTSSAISPLSPSLATPRIQISHPFYANDTSATAYVSVPSPSSFGTNSATGAGMDHLMNISASPKFDRHSVEELRISYLFTGQELGSGEIMEPQVQVPNQTPIRAQSQAQTQPSTPGPSSSLFLRPRGDAFSFSTPNPLRSF
ncbi:hypothetical protein BJ138DRAFT_1150938 [Hygrophoropsis aurantiaca]|uniref:Uncharacterized protein n=1 Tax=Hygrophoropsis aurantiaca TaxID=72124 RepID=A0ACB8ADW3_9AGAM|nr:hypothetical protein BJ138DRAFT_1150938 [Hygrophoropsis aurantiaca]